MRISDWSSDVCSSDLIVNGGRFRQVRVGRLRPRWRECVVLAGHGKSNTDIATILRLTPSTLTTYIEPPCGCSAVPPITQLVLAAFRDVEARSHSIPPPQHHHQSTSSPLTNYAPL